MRNILFILVLFGLYCPIYAVAYIELDTCRVPIQALLPSQRVNTMLDDIDDFVMDFTHCFGQSVRDNVVDTKTFWETARKLILSTDMGTESQRENLMSKFQQDLSNVSAFSVAYLSQQGQYPTVLSGRIYFPKNGDIKNIVIAHHYTIGANREAPSQTFTFEALLAAKGYVVLMPDYMGFGISRDSILPYLNASMTAQASLDMLNASIPFLYYRGVRVLSTELILCGYSQGAAAALAVQRLIETSYPEYTVLRTYIGAGPYSPADTYDYCVKMDKTSIPCAVPMLLQGMLVSEHLDYKMEDLLLPPLREHYQEWINSKEYTMFQINAMIGSNRVSEIMSPLALDKSRYPTNTFYEALKRNRIDGWMPRGSIYMFHSLSDDMVPFVNSTILQRYFESIGFDDVSYDFGEYGPHMSAALRFFQNLYNAL